MKTTPIKYNTPVEIFTGGLVKLHKTLKEEDVMKGRYIAKDKFDENPEIIIDFTTVTSIQRDYKYGGTVVIDQKNVCMVAEPLNLVLDAWIKVKEQYPNFR